MVRVAAVSSLALVALFSIFLSTQTVIGQGEPAAGAEEQPMTEKGKEKKDEQLKPGVLSSYGKFNYTAGVNQVSTSASGEAESPVSGSVSFTKDGCSAVVRNSSKDDTYSINFEVRGTNASGNTVVRQGYTATLKPGQSVTRTVSCTKDLNMAVILKSGRKVN